jgi:hypothetical protein
LLLTYAENPALLAGFLVFAPVQEGSSLVASVPCEPRGFPIGNAGSRLLWRRSEPALTQEGTGEPAVNL